MSQNQPDEPGEVKWIPAEIGVISEPSAKKRHGKHVVFVPNNEIRDAYGADESEAMRNFFRANVYCIRPLPASPVEFVSDATAEEIRRVVECAFDQKKVWPEVNEAIEVVLDRLRGPLAAGVEGGEA